MINNANDPAGSLRQPIKKSLTDWAHEWVATTFSPVARLLGRWNVSPNTITICGAILSICAGVLLALGYWGAAIAVMVVSGLLDGLDGLLARQAHQSSRFGAFLDSVLDRWSDSALFIGLLAWYTRAGMPLPAILAGIALATSLLVSYTRARAEGVNAQCSRGLFTRLERFIVLIAGLVLNQMTLALGVIAALSAFTAIQRIVYTYKYLQAHPEERVTP
jgi:CDP-diacylglycerol--glycerol-3-phosphate 3-phosphatidyltransferase